MKKIHILSRDRKREGEKITTSLREALCGLSERDLDALIKLKSWEGRGMLNSAYLSMGFLIELAEPKDRKLSLCS